jgi:putative phosphoesterase
MKVLVFSDSHGHLEPMERAILREKPDHVLHLGDYVRDAEAIHQKFPQLPLTYVAGNCDYGVETPERLNLTLCGKKIFMTHGHIFQVKRSYLRAIYGAEEQGAEVLLFGHTHRAECFFENGLWVLNPGAAGQGTYGVLTISEEAIDCRLANE